MYQEVIQYDDFYKSQSKKNEGAKICALFVYNYFTISSLFTINLQIAFC